MAQKYLLPCPNCSTNSEIETGHAGRTIECENCQHAIEVPTLRSIRSLELANGGASDTTRRERSKPVSALFSLGLGLAVFAGLAGGITYYTANQLVTGPDQEEVDQVLQQNFERVDQLNAAALWDVWENQTQEPPGEWLPSEFADNRIKAKIRKTVGNVLFVFAGIGLITMIASFFRRGSES